MGIIAKIKDVVIAEGQNESVGVGAGSASLPSKNFRAMRSELSDLLGADPHQPGLRRVEQVRHKRAGALHSNVPQPKGAKVRNTLLQLDVQTPVQTGARIPSNRRRVA